ncbi:hypothetical protein C8K30_10640 [Promicromonospora sp. AC04]|uniref:hypothetical protein n=1 Tax=Promicromonospora sp. AC04 TaxID=2135723 RepID=UPI000D3D266C|nr:hypothetical protein [Promicromonospora sp. AC04]PUB25953.1 hypothetical protein C8K30_10640 [Promicromonospora sp. AC04]
MTSSDSPHDGGAELAVRPALAAAEEAAYSGAAWLHVDYEPHLESFYAQCGLRPTAAGLMPLSGRRGSS